MARTIAYNRKINAPIRFLYYLEVFDLFLLLVFGVLIPLFVSSFLPVNIPLWYCIVWFVSLFFFLVSIKVGRAPGFVQHWIGKTFRPVSYHAGIKNVEYFKLSSLPQPKPTKNGEPVFSQQELYEISMSVLKLRQARREAEMMKDQSQTF